MKKATCLILSFLMFITSLFAQQLQNPCEDTLYLELKEKELEEMTDREYQYYLLKDEACMNYNNTQQVIQSQQSAAAIPNLLASLAMYILIMWWVFG